MVLTLCDSGSAKVCQIHFTGCGVRFLGLHSTVYCVPWFVRHLCLNPTHPMYLTTLPLFKGAVGSKLRGDASSWSTRSQLMSRHKISSSARSPRRDIFRSAWIRKIPMLPANHMICVTHTSHGAACKHSKIAYKLCWSLQGLTRFAWRAALDTETSLSANAAPAAAAASEIPRLSCWHGPPRTEGARCQKSRGWDFCWGGAPCLGRFRQKNVYQKLVVWWCV